MPPWNRIPARLRLWLVMACLALLPTGLYWNTIWSHYGMRDDYSILREAREEPGKDIQYCASQARPVYGWLLQTMFSRLDGVEDLSWARQASAILLGLLAATACAIMVSLCAWPLLRAATVAALLELVPTAQITVGWSILWPYALSALLALLAFALAESAFTTASSTRLRRAAPLLAAGALLLVATYCFQPNALFYLVPFAAALVTRLHRDRAELLPWALRHALLLAASLACAYLIMRALFAADVFHPSRRIAFEPDLVGKWWWYVRNVLPDALAFFVVNDDFGRTAGLYHAAAALTVAILLKGLVSVGRKDGLAVALACLGALVLLLTAAYGINLIAAERWATYRSLYPLVGVCLVFSAHLLGKIGPLQPAFARCGHALAALLLVAAALLARHQAYTLVAEPQMEELALVTREAAKLTPTMQQRIYVITPTPQIAPAPLISGDELGSLSTDSEWVPKEMLKQVLREKFPTAPKLECCEHLVSGPKPPAPGKFGVVLDLRPPPKPDAGPSAGS